MPTNRPNELPPWGTDAEPPDGAAKFRPRWWFWAGLVGMLVGWIIGLNLKPDLDDLHRAARELVPSAATIADKTLTDRYWVLFFPSPPTVDLELVSESTPESLAEEIVTHARDAGWSVRDMENLPGAIVLSLETTFLDSYNYVWRSPDASTGSYEADISVSSRDGIGKTITASASLGVGLLAAVLVGVLSRLRAGGDRRPHRPIRWWHLLGTLFLVLVFLIALWLVP